MFESKAAVKAYMAGDVFKSVVENPEWSDHLVRHYEVHSEASDIQNMIKRNAPTLIHNFFSITLLHATSSRILTVKIEFQSFLSSRITSAPRVRQLVLVQQTQNRVNSLACSHVMTFDFNFRWFIQGGFVKMSQKCSKVAKNC